MLADAALISEPFMLFSVIIVKDFLINIVRLLKIKKHLENGDFSCMLIIKNNCIERKKHMYKFLITLLLAFAPLFAFAHEHGDHGEKGSAEQATEDANKDAENKAPEPAKNLYEDPKQYYPKK